MTIKTWGERCEEFDDGHITTNADIQRVMNDEIDELRAEVERLQEVNTKVRNDMLKLFEIKNRFTGEVLFSEECESLKICVEAAVKGGVHLSYANLCNADLYNADLYSANLYYADLRSADFYSANLRSADLYSANLRGADFYNADLYNANRYRANLSDTFKGIREWVGLTDEEINVIDGANWDEDHKSWGIHDFARAIQAKLKEKNT